MKKSASYTLKGIQELFNQTHFGGFFIARRKQMAGNLDFRLNLLANTTGLQQGMDGAKTAQEWAKAHVSKDEVAFRKSLQGVRLSQVEYDTYLDFTYNFGQANWNGSSMLRNLKAGQYKQACDSLLKWKYVAKRDCSVRSNNCYGVWTRQVERHAKCMGAQ